MYRFATRTAPNFRLYPLAPLSFLLLNNYKVSDIFTVSGDLYAKQGAGWPVDVIVIEGKGKTERTPLTKEPPPLLKSWDEVGAKLHDAEKAIRVDEGTANAPGQDRVRRPGAMKEEAEDPQRAMTWAENRLFEEGLFNAHPAPQRPKAWTEHVIAQNPDLMEVLPYLEEKNLRPEEAESFEDLILSLIPTEGGL